MLTPKTFEITKMKTKVIPSTLKAREHYLKVFVLLKTLIGIKLLFSLQTNKNKKKHKTQVILSVVKSAHV